MSYSQTKLNKLIESMDDKTLVHWKFVGEATVGLLCRVKCSQEERVTGDQERVTCPKCLWILLAEENFIPQTNFDLH